LIQAAHTPIKGHLCSLLISNIFLNPHFLLSTLYISDHIPKHTNSNSLRRIPFVLSVFIICKRRLFPTSPPRHFFDPIYYKSYSHHRFPVLSTRLQADVREPLLTTHHHSHHRLRIVLSWFFTRTSKSHIYFFIGLYLPMLHAVRFVCLPMICLKLIMPLVCTFLCFTL